MEILQSTGVIITIIAASVTILTAFIGIAVWLIRTRYKHGAEIKVMSERFNDLKEKQIEQGVDIKYILGRLPVFEEAADTINYLVENENEDEEEINLLL
ncbi:MAG TPA: hypothetical protein PLS84_03150 [Salinivirgaceae bacterium]|nr:hypothetical protein [Salinivirgaceae bacterium]